METLIIIVAFWLILIGIYGAMPMLRTPRLKAPSAPRFVQNPLTEAIQRGVEATPAPLRTGVPRRQPLPSFPSQEGDPYAEVSMLRAQIEHLRSELVALSGHSDRDERARRPRRYKVGPYTDLPRPLRRQVKEVRNVRRPLHT